MGKVKDKSLSVDSIALRRLAVERLGEITADFRPPRTEHEMKRLVHELEVHQVELEIQNAELLQAREEEARALKKYTDLYDLAPVSYITLDRTGTIRAANLTISNLIGIERYQLIGRRFGLFITEACRPAFADFLEKVFTSPAKEVCELALLKEGNSELPVQIEAVAAESGEECRIALSDISERKRSVEVLQQAKEAAEATVRTKSQFLTNMSHELRTPMTGILGMLQLALEEDLAPVPRGYLNTTLSSARSLLGILNDILVMAKIDAGMLTIEEKPFSPRRCVTEAVDIITPEVRRKGLDIVISVAEEIPDMVAGDQARLRQVLLNLIVNAVKFTDCGKVEARVTAGRMTSDGKREITFTVADTGIGIPDDKKELLFQAFSQVDASYSRKFGGTGLGLVISREIVELMGGTMSFESEEGLGSTFFFTIPLRETRSGCDSQTAPETLSSEMVTAPEGGRILHLLIAEDDPTIRQVLGSMFKLATNYKFDFAEDGLKAVELWEKGNYDLVLMDIQMPRLDGFEATSAIRKKERERGGHTPIVAMTAHARKEDEEMCIASGMDAFISKPIDFGKTLQVIRKIIKQNSDCSN